MNENMQAVLHIFLAESEEGLAAMESGLIALEARPDDVEALSNVFRMAHTLKGNASTLGFSALASFAHTMEDVLDRLRSRTIEPSPERTTLLLQSVDVLRQILSDSVEGSEALGPEHQILLDRLARECDSQATEAAAAVADGESSESPAPAADRRAQSARSSLRIDTQRLDQLVGLVGELAVARERAAQLLHDRTTPRRALLEAQWESDKLYLDLHELVMSLRMVPVGPTFRQLARTVRDLALSLGKRARLRIEGEDAEVDNSVLQLLRDPLTHMVRNAIDHGIEPPDRRAAKGKDPTGGVTLRAFHERGVLAIELEDDGDGLDRERVLARARSRGLVADADEIDDQRLHELVFEPGLSTSEEVTGLSGRGVGLDVVRRNIAALRGTVRFSSIAGLGSKVTIRLPLTLAIIEGLIVRAGDERYILPLESVVESFSVPTAEAARDVSRGVLTLRGSSVPYVRMRRIVGASGPQSRREVVVLVRCQFGLAGLVVDSVVGQSQIVIKPLSKALGRLNAISAAAVLGDGGVTLVLDPARLVEAEAPAMSLAPA